MLFCPWLQTQNYQEPITKLMPIPQKALLKYQSKSKSDLIHLVLTHHPYLRPGMCNLQPTAYSNFLVIFSLI